MKVLTIIWTSGVPIPASEASMVNSVGIDAKIPPLCVAAGLTTFTLSGSAFGFTFNLKGLKTRTTNMRNFKSKKQISSIYIQYIHCMSYCIKIFYFSLVRKMEFLI